MNKGILMGSRVKKLSLVVKVVDRQTKQMIDHTKCTLFIENVFTKPLIHRSGYFMYMDLAAGTYNITVNATGYDPEIREIDTTTLDPLYPVNTIELETV